MGKRNRIPGEENGITSASNTPGTGAEQLKRGKKKKKKRDSDSVAESQPPADISVNGGSSKKKKKSNERDRKKTSPSPTPLYLPAAHEEPDGKDAYFHGPSALKLSSSDAVRAMPTAEQHQYLTKVAAQCEKLITLMHDSLSTFGMVEGDVGVEEQLTSDMIRLKRMPLARRYVEMTMWRRVKVFNRDRLATAEQLGYGRGQADEATGHGLLLHRAGDPDPRFVSYREAYLQDVVERFQDDLENIRERESLDADHVALLLRCLESGADLFANIKCIDEKETRNG